MANRKQRRAAEKKAQLSKTEANEELQKLRASYIALRQAHQEMQRKAQALQLAFISVLLNLGGEYTVPGTTFDQMAVENILGWTSGELQEDGSLTYTLLYGAPIVEGEVEENTETTT